VRKRNRGMKKGVERWKWEEMIVKLFMDFFIGGGGKRR